MTVSNARINRHNSIRDEIIDFVKKQAAGNHQVVKEMTITPANSNVNTIADIVWWEDGNAIAIDVTLGDPSVDTYILQGISRERLTATSLLERTKKNRYKDMIICAVFN